MSSPFRLSLSMLAATAVMLASAAEAGAAAKQAAPAPVFAQTIVVMPVKGTVFVSTPGRRGSRVGRAVLGAGVRTRVPTARAVASGSLIDVRGGEAVIVTASRHSGTTHTADLSGGVVQVTQQRADNGVTNLVLAGTTRACGSAQAAIDLGTVRVGVPGHRRRRRARGAGVAGVGLFRLVGKNESAVNDGSATYQGTETCHGTALADSDGTVTASLKGGVKSESLAPGETWLSRCSSPAQAAAVGRFCVAVLGDHESDGYVSYTTDLLTSTTASTYQLCQTTPSSPQDCQTWTLTTPDLDGYRDGLVSCPVSEAGSYSLSWRIAGVPLGISLPYTATAASNSTAACSGVAGTRYYPPGRSSIRLPSGIKIANSYALPTGWLGFISVYVTAGGAGQESLQGVVYQDAGGHPGNLVATTDAFGHASRLFPGPAVVNATDEPHYQAMYFKPEIEVPAGTYWFGVLTGGNSKVVAVRVEPAAPVVFNANPSAGASDPFGPFLSGTAQVSLQVGYSIDPPLGSSALAVPRDG